MTNVSRLYGWRGGSLAFGLIAAAASMGCSASPEVPAIMNRDLAAVRPCPSEVVAGYPPRHDLRVRGFDAVLEAMSEPALWCGSQPDSYRIVWLRSLSGGLAPVRPQPPEDGRIIWPPTSVRITHDGNGWRVTAVQLTNAVSREVLTRRERPLSAADAANARAAVATFRLWERPPYWTYMEAVGGGVWLIEGRLGSVYQAVVWTGANTEAADRLASVFLRLVDLDLSVTEALFPSPKPIVGTTEAKRRDDVSRRRRAEAVFAEVSRQIFDAKRLFGSARRLFGATKRVLFPCVRRLCNLLRLNHLQPRRK